LAHSPISQTKRAHGSPPSSWKEGKLARWPIYSISRIRKGTTIGTTMVSHTPASSAPLGAARKDAFVKDKQLCFGQGIFGTSRGERFAHEEKWQRGEYGIPTWRRRAPNLWSGERVPTNSIEIATEGRPAEPREEVILIEEGSDEPAWQMLRQQFRDARCLTPDGHPGSPARRPATIRA